MAIIYGRAESEKELLNLYPKRVQKIEDIKRVHEELKDGTKLKGRIFLTRLTENKNPPPSDLKPNEMYNQYAISVQNNFQVFAQPHNKGKPTMPLPPINKIPREKTEEMEILSSNEPWNVYDVLKNGMVVRIKLVVSEVFKVKDVYDQFGEPYLVVKSAPVFDYKPPDRKDKFA